MKVLLVVLTLLACPTAASAYEGERPADSRTQSAITEAVGYWADHGVVGCPQGVGGVVADDLTDFDGTAGGRGGGCQIWLAAPVMRLFRSDRAYAVSECKIVMHEVGHALGLPHTATGVMSPTHIETPGECLPWAHRVAPPRPRLHVTVRHAMRSYVRRPVGSRP